MSIYRDDNRTHIERINPPKEPVPGETVAAPVEVAAKVPEGGVVIVDPVVISELDALLADLDEAPPEVSQDELDKLIASVAEAPVVVIPPAVVAKPQKPAKR